MSEITFTPIPKWILKNRVLSASELYVYSFMYDGWNYATKQNRKYQISIKKLISEIGYDKKTILSAIEKMEKNEIFFVTRDKRDDNRDAKNIYEFNTEKVWVEKSPLTPNNSSTNESGENSQIRVEKSPLHTKENKEKKNNINSIDIVSRTGNADEEVSLNFTSSEDSFNRVEAVKKRIAELWINPQPKEYKLISDRSDVVEMLRWLRQDLKKDLSEDEWYSGPSSLYLRWEESVMDKYNIREEELKAA